MMTNSFNPFAFYGMEEHFFPNEQLVRSTFLELSRKHHPDYFPYDTPEHEEALHYSDLNNRAYKVLSRFEDRLHYILEHHGLLQEGEKNILPPAFLYDMLELNDMIDEAHAGDMSARMQAESLLSSRMLELKSEMEQVAKAWDEHAAHEYLGNLHSLYQQYRYLLRLERNFSAGVE
jgi:molecular chaperone HscB